MLSIKTTIVPLVTAILWWWSTSPAPGQLFRKRENHSTDTEMVGDNAFQSGLGIVPNYGYDPHFIYNPYPWHAPAMYSGFRHRHLPAPIAPAGDLPNFREETAPLPRR